MNISGKRRTLSIALWLLSGSLWALGLAAHGEAAVDFYASACFLAIVSWAVTAWWLFEFLVDRVVAREIEQNRNDIARAVAIALASELEGSTGRHLSRVR